MSYLDQLRNNRILIVDDNPDIHLDFQKILSDESESAQSLDGEAEILFGKSERTQTQQFELHSAYQGEEGLQLVKRSVERDEPYAVAFVDMRMPPGWDGLQTIPQLWKADPRLEIVICTAFSDHSWDEIVSTIGPTDQLIILKKPFDIVEVLQLATSLSQKWSLARMADSRMKGLEQMVRDATDESVRAHRSKMQFLSNISHELLTPLHGIIGMRDLLLDTTLDEEQRAYLQDLSQCYQEVEGLITQIISHNTLESGEINLQKASFDLMHLGAGLVESHHHTAQKKGIDLKVEGNVSSATQVVGDEKRIRQILGLLVDNAIKFSRDCPVVIRMALGEAEGSNLPLSLSVIDQGVGIPAVQLERLASENLWQGNGSTTRTEGGIGLGLTLSKSLAQVMGGSITIESQEGKGTHAMLSVPVGLVEQN